MSALLMMKEGTGTNCFLFFFFLPWSVGSLFVSWVGPVLSCSFVRLFVCLIWCMSKQRRAVVLRLYSSTLPWLRAEDDRTNNTSIGLGQPWYCYWYCRRSRRCRSLRTVHYRHRESTTYVHNSTVLYVGTVCTQYSFPSYFYCTPQ